MEGFVHFLLKKFGDIENKLYICAQIKNKNIWEHQVCQWGVVLTQ
jgi:hypothetical protein